MNFQAPPAEKTFQQEKPHSMFSRMVVDFQGTDRTMLSKLHNQHGKNKNYLQPKSQMNMSFGLNHFAGVVFYEAQGSLRLSRLAVPQCPF